MGHFLSEKGVLPDPAKLRGIKELNPSSNISQLRSVLGMFKCPGRFWPNLAQTTAPLRGLLQKKSEWVWGPSQNTAFDSVKALICSEKCMAMYDPRLPTILTEDAASFSLGAILFQKQRIGERRPIVFASRSLTKTEQRNAQVEKELALTRAAERFDKYIRGIEVTFETDHKPFVSLLRRMPITLLTPRVQSSRMRLTRYQFEIVYVPCKSLITADAVSRAPTKGDKLAGEPTASEAS